MSLALLLLLAMQDPVKDLLSRIVESDPQAAHRAIAAIAELPEADRRRAEQESASLPAYYRNVLKAELKSRVGLADATKASRVSFEGTAGPLAQLGRLPLVISPGQGVSDAALPSFAVDFKNKPAMEALGEILVKSRQIPRNHGGTRALEIENFLRWIGDPHAAGQFMVLPIGLRFRERADFSGEPERVASLEFLAVSDPAAGVVTWRKDVRVVEGVTDAGDAVALSVRKPATSVRENEEWIGFVSRNPTWNFDLRLVIDNLEAAKIARLRLEAVARVARRMAEYRLAPKAEGGTKMAASDGEFEISVEEKPHTDVYTRKFKAVIRPLKMKPEVLLELPLMIEAELRTVPCRSYFIPKVVGDGVEYEISTYTLVSRPEFMGPTLGMKIAIPVELVDRPVHFEFRDIPLK